MDAIEFRFDYQALAFGPGDAALLICALLIDVLFGAWPGLRRFVPHPALMIAALVGELARRLNREQRGARTRLFRGLIASAIVVGLAALAGWVLSAMAGTVPFAWVLIVLIIAALTVQRAPFDEASRVSIGFVKRGPAGGREAAAGVIGPAAAAAEPEELIRTLLRHLAGRFADGLVGGVFWFLVLGFPGLVVYRAVNISGRLLDDGKPEIGLFGFVPTRLNDAVGLLPTWAAGLVLTLAALFVPGANPMGVLPAMLAADGAGDHHARGAAAPAFAGALGLDLSGAAKPDGLRPAGSPSTTADIVRGQYLYAVGGLLVFGLIVIVAALRFAV